MTHSIDEYAPDELHEWYREHYDKNWFDRCDSVQYLIDFYAAREKYRQRFETWFEDIRLKGRGMDLGFSTGKTLHWLLQKYPEITLDSIDFNPNVRKVIPFLKALNPRIGRLLVEDCTRLSAPDMHYDFVTALDFYEHTPRETYLRSVGEVERITRPDAYFLVYFGKGSLHEHINLCSDEQVIRDVTSCKFSFSQRRGGLLVFRRSCNGSNLIERPSPPTGSMRAF